MKCPTCYPSTERPPSMLCHSMLSLGMQLPSMLPLSACQSPTTHLFLGMPSSLACCPLACLPRRAFFITISCHFFSVSPPHLGIYRTSFWPSRFLVTRLQTDRDNLHSIFDILLSLHFLVSSYFL
jgi:hypothetical protein